MPNLSVEKIAGALAVLGTSVVLAACGGDPQPAKAPVTSTETAAPGAGDGAKAADGHCGAGKEHKTGEASCSAAKTGSETSAASTTPPAATPAAATPAPPATPATDAKAATDPKKPDATKKPAAPAAPAKKPTGAASCGAGTCSAKK